MVSDQDIEDAISEASRMVAQEIRETNHDFAIGIESVYRLITQFEDLYGDRFSIPAAKDDLIHNSKHYRQLVVVASFFSSIAAFKYQEMTNDPKLNFKDQFNYRIFSEKMVDMLSRGMANRAPNE